MISSPIATAQMGPVDVNGIVEYQYRRSDSSDVSGGSSHIGTWQTEASTFLWRPWIAQVHAGLGLTRNISKIAGNRQDGTSVTGGLRLNLFQQSRFPFVSFYDRRDSRLEGDTSNIDVLTETYGFMQQFQAKRGGRYSLDFRRTSVDNLFDDPSRPSLGHVTDVWQGSARKTFGRNQFVLESSLSDIDRADTQRSQERIRHTLRHQFRSSSNFFLEDTTFYGAERIGTDGFDRERRFLQFNGISTWRPDTQKPLVVTGRGLLQANDSGGGSVGQTATSGSIAGSVTYQFSDTVTFGGTVGIGSSDDDGGQQSTAFQRVRADYHSRTFDLGQSDYRWNGAAQVGNRIGGARDELDGNSVQDVMFNLSHNITRPFDVNANRRFEIGFAQFLSGMADSDDQNHQSISHSAWASMNGYRNGTQSYIRLSANDRRMFGDSRNVFQLVNLQASRSTQAGRFRAWSGGLTIQYGRTVRREQETSEIDSSTFSYSVNLNYRHNYLFGVPNLNFYSELRMLSSDFVSEDPFDDELDPTNSRTDADFRNRLDYRIGLLQIRLEANWRQIDDNWNSMFLLSVRRYFGFR